MHFHHLPVFLIYSDVKVNFSPKREFIFKRSLSPDNVARFCIALNAIDWNSLLSGISNPQLAFSIFHTRFSLLYNKYFPLKKVKLGYKTNKPWLTKGIKNSIRTKNKLYIRSLKHPSFLNEQNYLRYKSKLNYLLRKLERNYIESMLKKHKSNLKKTWQIMKDIINRRRKSSSPPEYFDLNGEYITDKNEISNGFNKFYVNVGPNLSKSLPNHNVNPMSYLKQRNCNSMFVTPTDETEIEEIVMSLKDSAAGWDGMSAKILKQSVSYIKSPLSYVFNLSLSCGYFPKELKLAKVLPLYKADSKVLFSNYRPVSVLRSLCTLVHYPF